MMQSILMPSIIHVFLKIWRGNTLTKKLITASQESVSHQAVSYQSRLYFDLPSLSYDHKGQCDTAAEGGKGRGESPYGYQPFGLTPDVRRLQLSFHPDYKPTRHHNPEGYNQQVRMRVMMKF
jgi:hypothetical protein